MKTTVSKSARKAAIRYAVLVKQLVSVDGDFDAWKAKYRKTWGRRKVDALLGDAYNRLDTVAKRFSLNRQAVAEIEELRWSGPVDRPWNFSKRENAAALKALNKSLQELCDEAFRRFGAGQLSHIVFVYAERVRELAERTRDEYLAQQERIAAEKNAEEVAPVEEAAPARQAFDFEIQADGALHMVKTDDAANASGFIVKTAAVPGPRFNGENSAPAVSLQAVLDAGRRVDGPAAAPAYGAPSNAFIKGVKSIIATETIKRLANIVERFQNAKTSQELAAVVFDACREVQSFDGWENCPETSIIDDAAERFAAELQVVADESERFPRLQAITGRLVNALSVFAVKALAAA